MGFTLKFIRFFITLRKVEKMNKLILKEHEKEFKFNQKNDKIFIV